MLFPYKIRISDPEMVRIFQVLKQKRAATVPKPHLSRMLGYKLKPIRKEFFIASEEKYKRSFIALSPNIKDVKIKPIGKLNKYFDITFNWD